MKTNLFKILAVFFAFGLFSLASCEKPDPDSQSAEDDARGGAYMADAFALGNDNAGDDGGGKAFYPGMEVERFPLQHKVVITFDSCDYRGYLRYGVVNIQHVRQTGEGFGLRAFNLIITFENYTMDGVGLDGTISTSFGGTYAIPEITVVATEMVVSFTDDKELRWTSEKTFKILEGFGNLEVKNIIEMSGTVDGVNREGNTFNSVHSVVRVERECGKYPVSGKVTIKSDKGTTIVNYGDGECDNLITISNNGATIEFSLD